MAKRSPLADSLARPSDMEHKSKKLKVSGSPNHAAAGVLNASTDAGESEWTTVERKSESSTLPLRPDISTPNAFANLLQSGEKKVDNNAEWSKVEKRKAKKARKVEEKSENSPPRFYYVNSEIIKRREAVTIGDIRDLTLHLLGEAAPQPWLKVENRQAIRKVVVLFVPGILPEHLRIRYHPANATTNPNLPISIPLLQETNSAQQGMPVVVKTLFGGTKEIVPDIKDDAPKLPFVARTFSHACPTRAPGDALRMHSVLGAFFQGPISAEEKKRRTAALLKAGKDIAADDPTRYVLTPTQMLENEYPLPSYMKDASGGPEAGSSHLTDEGWKETPKPEENESGTPEVIAIDCEMCLTEDGKELTRVCAIDFRTGKVLLDKLVKPPKPVLDYLTRWSGINEESLRDITTTLQNVRDEFMTILSSQSKTGSTPILLGHSLESDLRALKLAHSRCIDTALLYHHPRGRPLKPGLAWLTKKWCDREIQNRGEGGHDAEEDARACIELLERKLKGGPSFGEYKSTTEFESIFERLKRSIHGSSTGEPGSGTGAKLRTAVVDRGNPATWHGAGAGHCVACTNDDEVAKGILGCIEDSDFVWARLSGVAEAQNWLQPKSNAENSVQQNPPEADPAAVENALKILNSHLSLIHASLPPRTAFVVFTGHSDPRPMVALQARKNAFENALRASQANSSASGSSVSVPEGVRWTASDARDLEEAVERARQGMLFLSLK